MLKREALKLKPGDQLIWSDSKKADWRYTAVGTVIKITEKGGILVKVLESKTRNRDWEGPGNSPDSGTEVCVPYSWVQHNA